MVDYDNVFFNAAAFIGGLFVLEYGADTFIDHTAKVASRLGVSPTLIALLTAGAEWEELVVVVAAISQHRSSLALGNILGSSISNILGAFSLGLIFSPTDAVFDRSAKIYTSLLLALTSAFVVFLALFSGLGRIGGAILVATFVLYMASIGYCIYKGIVAAPEDDDDSDNNSDGDSDSDSDTCTEKGYNERRPSRSSTSTLRANEEAAHHETIALVDNDSIELKSILQRDNIIQTLKPRHWHRHSLIYHIVHLALGFLALSLSGYILSHSISTLATSLSLSSSLVGITILSFATTLPEKLVAVMGGAKKQAGIVVASTAGSNIFLLTLCAGVLFLSGYDGEGEGDEDGVIRGKIGMFEALAVWAASALFFGVVVVGGRSQRWMGWVLLGFYVGFICVEFAVFRE